MMHTGAFRYDLDRFRTGNFCLIHVSLVPVLNVVGEQLYLLEISALEENVMAKLSQFCHVPKENIVTIYDVLNIWHIPLLLRVTSHEAILKVLNLQCKGILFLILFYVGI
ncbi:hypothetical protein UlMin_041585 [Ulmus minor]